MSLSVTEAVNCRISVRAFLPKPVPCEAVVEILDEFPSIQYWWTEWQHSRGCILR